MDKRQDNLDKAGVEYWNQTERNTDIPLKAFGPSPGLRGFGRRMWHEELAGDLAANLRPSAELLELGCGGSAYLPYFANQLKFKISGIDYSPGGVEIARRMCQAHGVTPSLYCTDFFKAPTECQDRYDAVVSFGVVEHFTDTNATIEAFARFVRPGGRLMTVVPNMQGLCGLGQRLIARDVFQVHELIDPDRLRVAHERAGLTVLKCHYFMFSNFGVINPGLHPSLPKALLFSALRGATAFAWALESLVGRFHANRYTSPYVVCVAEKPTYRTAPHSQ